VEHKILPEHIRYILVYLCYRVGIFFIKQN
jgi:hypothetical protein